MSIPRLHHYLPQFYLKGFTSHSGVGVWVFDREKREYREQGTKSVGAIRDYYSVVLPTGERDPTLETMLAELEGRIAPVIARLDNTQLINHDERVELSLFLGLLSSAVPSMRKSVGHAASELTKKIMQFSMADPIRVESLLRDFEGPVDARAVHDFIQTGDYEVKFGGNQELTWTVGLGLEAGRVFSTMAGTWFMRRKGSRSSPRIIPLRQWLPRSWASGGGMVLP